jgi:hypothetical protein
MQAYFIDKLTWMQKPVILSCTVQDSVWSGLDFFFSTFGCKENSIGRYNFSVIKVANLFLSLRDIATIAN